MNEVAISKFKAKCLSLLDEVSKTKIPLRVTRRGKPVTDVIPVDNSPQKEHWIGSLSASLEITGDIISPVIDASETEAWKR